MSSMVWQDWVRRYLESSAAFWASETERQVKKLQSVLSLAQERFGLDQANFSEALISAVERRAAPHEAPIYLVNLGGCGSHWISRMMAQAGGLVDAGEVYLPPEQYKEFMTLDHRQGARVLDALEVAHGLLHGLTPDRFETARMINSAHGCEKIPFYRALRPGARIVHLARDPRDRTMSVSIRKPEFRAYEATGLDDFQYALAKARRSQSYWERYQNLKRKADLEISYEAFRRDSTGNLVRVLAAVGVEIDASSAERVALVNSPEFLRSPAAKGLNKGNLDQGGIAASWKDIDDRFRRMLHAVTAPAIEGQGYQLCDCFPGEVLKGIRLTAQVLQNIRNLPTGDGFEFQWLDEAEGKWVPTASIVERGSDGARVRLRIRGPLDALPGAGVARGLVTDLCAAGIKSFDNQSLCALGLMPNVVGLDLAGSGVSGRIGEMQFPSLQRVNVSGCAAAIQHPGSSTDY